MPEWLSQGLIIAAGTCIITGIFTYFKNQIIKIYKSKFYKTKLFEFYLYFTGFICGYTLFLLRIFNNKFLIIVNIICTLVNAFGLCSTFYEFYAKDK